MILNTEYPYPTLRRQASQVLLANKFYSIASGIINMQRLQRSRQNSSRRTSPERTLLDQTHSEIVHIDKSRYTEVTISTNDDDVPFIALYKPNIHKQKTQSQAASKVHHAFRSIELLRKMLVFNRLLEQGPKEKLTNMRVTLLKSCVEKVMLRMKEKAFRGLAVNGIKKNSVKLGLKMVSTLHKGAVLRNVRQGLVELRRNRLLAKIHELSDQKQQSRELDSLRKQLFSLNQQCFSEQLIAASRPLQTVANCSTYLASLQESQYSQLLRKQIQRYEQTRHASSPRIKETLHNETVISVMANIISAYQQTTKEYDNYCEQLQAQLNSYKDAEGIKELREVIREKEKTIKEIESFVGEISRMDIELRKFTPENRLNLERVMSTLKTQEKKIEVRSKQLQELPGKMAASRSYLASVITTVLTKMEENQKRHNELEAERKAQERQQADQLRQLRRQLEQINNELEQERSKLAMFISKKDNHRVLEDLKRKWKNSQHFRTLVEYTMSLHNQIQQLQTQQRQVQRQQRQVTEINDSVVGGTDVIKKYLESGIEAIEEQLPPPPLPQQDLAEGFNQIIRGISEALERAYAKLQLNKASQQKQLVFESDVKKVERGVIGDLELDEQESLIAQRLFSQLKSTQKEIERYNEASSSSIINKIDRQAVTVLKELKTTIFELEEHLKHKFSQRSDNQALKVTLSKLEELIQIVNDSERAVNQLSSQNRSLVAQLQQLKDHNQRHGSRLQQQIAENNRLIQQLSFKSVGTSRYDKSLSTQTSKVEPSTSKAEPSLERQILLQEQIIRLKSQHEEAMSHHKEEIMKWKQENTSLWQKIVILQDELRLSHARIQPEGHQVPEESLRRVNQQSSVAFVEGKAMLEEMRERFMTLEQQMLEMRQIVPREDLSNRIEELIRLLHQSEDKVRQLSVRNSELSAMIEQTRQQYRTQIQSLHRMQSQQTSTVRKSQLHVVDHRQQENHQYNNRQLQEQLSRLKTQYETSYRAEINDLKKYKQETILLRSKISQVETLLTRKNKDLERVQNRLRQTETNMATQREKNSALRLEVSNLEKELGRSHSETDKLAAQAREEVRKITMVIRSLEEELDKKTKECQTLQQQSNDKSRNITSLQRQLRNYQGQLNEVVFNYRKLQEKNETLTSQLTHLKAEFYSIQVQIQSDQTSNVNERLAHLENEIRGKEQTISNILAHSKTASGNLDNLNQQLFEAREELLKQETRYEEQIGAKNALINRLQHKIIEMENILRTSEQKCILLEQNGLKKEQGSPHPRDREIQLLHQQIASLQQFLGDLSHQYKELQSKYHEEKHRFGRFYDNAQRERSMEEIDKAIHDLADSSELSEQVKSLIVNNQKLQISIEELEEERKKLLEKARAQPEREYVVELLFNIILGASRLQAQSQKGNSIWNELVQINQRCSDVGQLFTQLQKFTLRLLSRSL